jgi:hypothetical protein
MSSTKTDRYNDVAGGFVLPKINSALHLCGLATRHFLGLIFCWQALGLWLGSGGFGLLLLDVGNHGIGNATWRRTATVSRSCVCVSIKHTSACELHILA